MDDASSRYRLIKAIGQGGMGEVLLAEDCLLERQVAIKLLTDLPPDDTSARERIQREARSAAALDHPFICKIYELSTLNGHPCIVMEHVPGETLELRLRLGALPRMQALATALEIAEALEEAHARRIIHRDLKPGNVILTPQGHVKVMDFGLAKRLVDERTPAAQVETVRALTESGIAMGTPAYMSPEQALGLDLDERTDIFSFGIVCYQMLAGRHPFLRATPAATIAAILHDTPPPIARLAEGVSDDLALVIDRLLAKRVGDRYQAFRQIVCDLRELITRGNGHAHRGVQEPSPLTQRSALIGRAGEARLLRQHLEEALRGHGAFMLIEGDAGVGKTWLAERLLDEARRAGCLPLTGRCEGAADAAPYQPIVDLLGEACRAMSGATLRDVLGDAAPELARLMPELRRFVPDARTALDLPADQQRRYLASCVCDTLDRASRIAPLAILLDDLERADESTLLLLPQLAQRLPQMAVFAIGTCRDADHASDSATARMLEALTRHHHLTRVALKGLTRAETGELLAALAGSGLDRASTGQPTDLPESLTQVIHDATEGNPFFATELFRHLQEECVQARARHAVPAIAAGCWDARAIEELDLPKTVRLVISRRLQRLDAATRRVLAAAAIVGPRFEPALVEALADGGSDAVCAALEEGERARLVRPPASRRERRWSFANELIRQTLAGDLTRASRQRLHRRIADRMLAIHGETGTAAPVSEIAHHLFCAGPEADPATTLQYVMRAGDAAWAVYADAETVRHYRRALELMDEEPQGFAARAMLIERLGAVLGRSGHRTAALEQYHSVRALYATAGDQAGQARTLRAIGDLHRDAGEGRLAMQSYRAGITLLDAAPDLAELAHLSHAMGRAAFRAGDLRGAIDWAQRALDHAQRSIADTPPDHARCRDAVAALAHAHNTLGIALARQGHTAEAVQHLEQSIALATQHDLPVVACRGYANLGVIYGSFDARRAIDVSLAGLDLAKKIGAPGFQSHIYANLASAYCALTNQCEDDGVRAAQAAITLDRRLGQRDHLAVPLIVLGQIHQCQGDLACAQACYREALALAEAIGDPQLRFPCYDGLATVCLDLGDRAQATHYMQQAQRVCQEAGIDPDSFVVLPFLC